MESDDVRAQLRDLERAAAAPHLDVPPDPRWFAPLLGGLAAAWILTAGLDAPWAPAVAVLFLLAFSAAAYWVNYGRIRATVVPNPWSPTLPPELRRLFTTNAAELVAVVGILVLLWWLWGSVVAAIGAFVLFTGVRMTYDRAYRRAADAVRERLR